MQAVNQIRLNRGHKETCEMDWSDKVEAYAIDETCAGYHNQSAQVRVYPHSTRLQERWAPGPSRPRGPPELPGSCLHPRFPTACQPPRPPRF